MRTRMELTGHHDGCGLTELCKVIVADEPHPVNGACHEYHLFRELCGRESERFGILEPAEGLSEAEQRGDHGQPLTVECGRIQFQRGPRNVWDSTPGTLDGAVLSVLIHRFECFQAGPFGCAENEDVLGHLLEVRRLMIARAQERRDRGVLGKNEK